MAIGAPLINGFLYAHADVQLRVQGLLFVGISSVDYDDALSRGQVYGTAAISLGLTKGSYKAKATVEMYLPAALIFELAMQPIAVPLGGLRFVPISVSISFAPSGAIPLPTTTDQFTGYITNISQSSKVSDDAIVRKYEFMIPGALIRNGVPAIIEPNTISAVA